LGVRRLANFLRRHPRIALDTSLFIYQLEANARYLELTHHLFAWLERLGHSAVTSTITMTELLVQPYRDSAESRVNDFYGLLSTYPNLQWIPPDLQIADIAARLRAEYRLRTPDALQAATAVHARVGAVVTNDAAFGRIKAFETLILDDLL
jgi:predicted nucleic acid-binding protein